MLDCRSHIYLCCMFVVYILIIVKLVKTLWFDELDNVVNCTRQLPYHLAICYSCQYSVYGAIEIKRHLLWRMRRNYRVTWCYITLLSFKEPFPIIPMRIRLHGLSYCVLVVRFREIKVVESVKDKSIKWGKHCLHKLSFVFYILFLDIGLTIKYVC